MVACEIRIQNVGEPAKELEWHSVPAHSDHNKGINLIHFMYCGGVIFFLSSLLEFSMYSGRPHESVLRKLSQETVSNAWWLLKTLGWGGAAGSFPREEPMRHHLPRRTK